MTTETETIRLTGRTWPSDVDDLPTRGSIVEARRVTKADNEEPGIDWLFIHEPFPEDGEFYASADPEDGFAAERVLVDDIATTKEQA